MKHCTRPQVTLTHYAADDARLHSVLGVSCEYFDAPCCRLRSAAFIIGVSPALMIDRISLDELSPQTAGSNVHRP